MPARAISTATISFGLVSIPVKLYSAAESQSALSFNQIHKKDGSRVKQQLINSRSGEVVPREEIVKGYEFAKGQYVLFEPEELKTLEAAATHTIDIVEFLKAEQIERQYLDKVYYLGTEKGGARAYKLLSQALVETGRIGIGKYAARGKQYLVMVRPMQNGLVMEQLHYPDELRAFSEVPIEDATVKPAELKLATQLIEQAASDKFEPENYRDEVRERMLELIQQEGRRRRHHGRADGGAGAQDRRHHGGAQGEPRRWQLTQTRAAGRQVRAASRQESCEEARRQEARRCQVTPAP